MKKIYRHIQQAVAVTLLITTTPVTFNALAANDVELGAAMEQALKAMPNRPKAQELQGKLDRLKEIEKANGEKIEALRTNTKQLIVDIDTRLQNLDNPKETERQKTENLVNYLFGDQYSSKNFNLIVHNNSSWIFEYGPYREGDYKEAQNIIVNYSDLITNNYGVKFGIDRTSGIGVTIRDLGYSEKFTLTSSERALLVDFLNTIFKSFSESSLELVGEPSLQNIQNTLDSKASFQEAFLKYFQYKGISMSASIFQQTQNILDALFQPTAKAGVLTLGISKLGDAYGKTSLNTEVQVALARLIFIDEMKKNMYSFDQFSDLQTVYDKNDDTKRRSDLTNQKEVLLQTLAKEEKYFAQAQKEIADSYDFYSRQITKEFNRVNRLMKVQKKHDVLTGQAVNSSPLDVLRAQEIEEKLAKEEILLMEKRAEALKQEVMRVFGNTTWGKEDAFHQLISKNSSGITIAEITLYVSQIKAILDNSRYSYSASDNYYTVSLATEKAAKSVLNNRPADYHEVLSRGTKAKK